jgi:hypothetical protein
MPEVAEAQTLPELSRQAARAISAARSQVVAFMLARSFIRSSHATRLRASAFSVAHFDVFVTKRSLRPARTLQTRN